MKCRPDVLVVMTALFFYATSQGQTAHYEPDPSSVTLLGSLQQVLQISEPIEVGSFSSDPAKFITKLVGGQIYFEVSKMDIDDDGSPDGAPDDWTPYPVRNHKSGDQFIDCVHQKLTSYGGQLPKRADGTDYFSSFETPYVVLPKSWSGRYGLQAGDGAIVIRGSQLIYAVVADFGPNDKIGEMSIKAHQLFGSKVIVNGYRAKLPGRPSSCPNAPVGPFQLQAAIVTRNAATVGPFLVIVFPNTSLKKRFKSVDESLRPQLQNSWKKLTGVDAP